jgi:integrase
MSVKVRPHWRGGWDVDITVLLASGKRFRDRHKLAGSYSRTTAREWGERRERALLLDGPSKRKKEVPTLNEFASRFIDGYARANRQKPSGIAAKLTILNTHLIPALGSKKLDAISSEDVQRLKHRLSAKSPKTVNNVLTVLNVLLKSAVEWQVAERVPCSIRLLPIPKGSAQFHDFEAFERLVRAAERLDRQTHLIVLLGGEAGLRCGEMMALQWDDVDLEKRQICVERSDWKGHVTATKGGRIRHVPMTVRLASALRGHRHLRGPRVLSQNDSEPLTQKIVQDHVRRAARSAKVKPEGVHVLRHTFCSHLAMRGAPTRAIQELAGHQDLSTTQRYMHLSPAAIEGAIRLLDQARPAVGFGDILETGDHEAEKASG